MRNSGNLKFCVTHTNSGGSWGSDGSNGITAVFPS